MTSARAIGHIVAWWGSVGVYLVFSYFVPIYAVLTILGAIGVGAAVYGSIRYYKDATSDSD